MMANVLAEHLLKIPAEPAPSCVSPALQRIRFIYTGLLEYFVVQLKLAMFGAAFISFPVVATQIYMFVASKRAPGRRAVLA